MTSRVIDITTNRGKTGPQPTHSMAEAHARVRESFRDCAREIGKRRRWRRGYLDELVRRYRFYVEPGATVLELGVGSGDLLASLSASRAVGVDISPEMLEVARAAHPTLELIERPAEDLGDLQGPFDYIILSDLTLYLYDIVRVLREARRMSHRRTRIIFNFHSRAWQPLLHLLSAAGVHHGGGLTNWVTTEDVTNLLELSGFQVLRTDVSTLIPAALPGLSTGVNRIAPRLGPLRKACLINWVVARPRQELGAMKDLSVTVVCPARNEAGNIREIVDRVPRMGKKTELIFVEGNSTDDTWHRIRCEVDQPRRRDIAIRAFQQPGRGKGDAVRVGFANASCDILMILDADLTVPPEELPLFFETIAGGHGELINGSRLVYPMSDHAMRFLNVLGNKLFARVFSYLLDQPLKDTLCGTKALTAEDYTRIARGRSYFGELDPFGDFDLLFGASKLCLRIVEVPVRYRDRSYGHTNINRFRNGLTLLRM
ncbi:MAG: bifunctional class I SAM-dependent methyltransferase/glycosyltransferase family 2 protein, partial [Myxococcota bacterium]